MRRRAFIPLLAAAASAGCSASPDAEPQIRQAVVIVPSTQAAAPSAAPREPAEVHAEVRILERPKNPACVLKSSEWKRAPALRLLPDGPPYATVSRDAVVGSAHIPLDASERGITVEVDVGPVELRAIAAVADIRLFPAKPLLLAGIFAPRGATALVLAEPMPGILRLGMAQPPKEIAELETNLEGDSDCGGASLNPTKIDPTASLPKPFATAALVGDDIPLSTSAGAAPTARLVPGTSSRTVGILERMSKKVRISWELQDGTVVGWVDDASLGPVLSGAGSGYGSGSGRLSNRDTRKKRVVRCRAPIALGAAVGGQRAIVGTVQPGTTLYVYGPVEEDQLEIRIPDAAVQLAAGALFFGAKSDLEPCPPVPPT